MCGLTDGVIKEELASGHIVVNPLGPQAIQPASIDVRLSNQIRWFRSNSRAYVDVRDDNSDLTVLERIYEERPYMLHPGKFVLGSTLESLEIPADIISRVEGKSSLARIGLLIHSTAGYIDPGFKGKITLELANVSELPITLIPGMKIAQLSFWRTVRPADHPYGSDGLGSKYQNQKEPTASRMYREFK